MATPPKPTTVLDVSKGLGYGLLYNPVIGTQSQSQYPFAIRFPSPSYRRPHRRNSK